MQKNIITYLFLSFLAFFTACCSENFGYQEEDLLPPKSTVPTVVVILNWNDYSENDPTLWHNKVFNKSYNSINRWFAYNTESSIELLPVKESDGIIDDGVIIVDMGKNNPGGYDDAVVRDVELRAAITSKTVDDAIDFSVYDLDKNGDISYDELQIIFIVSGGEQAYGDSAKKSVWAHTWNYEDSEAPKVDGVNLMRDTGNVKSSGIYAMFGARHDVDRKDEHKAVVGIMAHEMGHALFDLYDLYDNGGGSGLGYYDIMSGGTWARKSSDSYDGETPTQYTIFTKIDAKLQMQLTTLNSSGTVTIKCSANEGIKLTSVKSNEYFLLECRDTQKLDSDRSFNYIDSAFSDNRLFGALYHVDEEKAGNSESGEQTEYHHYKVALVQKDDNVKMTAVEGIDARFTYVYTTGDTIESSKTKLYDNSLTEYSIRVVSSNYSTREMTFKITK